MLDKPTKYWVKHRRSWWFAFLSFLWGFRPKWLGKLKTSGRWYDVYHNEETSTKYLVDKEYGYVWYRKEDLK